ncbi:hypothetical protein CEXT_274321 [Caerostris extrusa]|uniref:Uncharacterized protein n=1 Tax=Caerostris extrusa TaxID=172846 RepID=A0AAV4XXJ0_CAEEX|nr:hypothetical protein CEXT_274321 [Caerostris extrusa]
MSDKSYIIFLFIKYIASFLQFQTISLIDNSFGHVILNGFCITIRVLFCVMPMSGTRNYCAGLHLQGYGQWTHGTVHEPHVS